MRIAKAVATSLACLSAAAALAVLAVWCWSHIVLFFIST